MNAETIADDDVTAKASASPCGPPGGRKDAAEDDTTVKISPGGPPPRDPKRMLQPAQWTLSPGQSLIISVGKGLSLNLSLGMDGTGCEIKTERCKKRPK
jgi:hypothetical protein